MNTDNYYDQISEGYEELHYEEQIKKIELIKQYFTPEKNKKLLDVGCGTGVTTQPWKCIRTGLDPAKKLIERARDKDKINYVIAGAENIPFPNKSFDYVISITAIQNFSDIKKGLLEIKRVGKEKFILTALKKSQKIELITKLIKEIFQPDKIIEEDKDMIFIKF